MIFTIDNGSRFPEEHNVAFVASPAHFEAWFNSAVKPVLSQLRHDFPAPHILAVAKTVSWRQRKLMEPNEFVASLFPSNYQDMPNFQSHRPQNTVKPD